MKIVYITMLDVSLPLGSVDHVLGVSRGWAQLGHEVHLVAAHSDTPDERAQNLHLHLLHLTGMQARQYGPLVSKAACDVVREVQPDFIYVRGYPLDYLLLIRHLRRTRIPIFYEMNLMMASEYASKGQAWRGRVYRVFEGLSLKACRGWLPVTHEIYREGRRAAGIQRPYLIARNGVDTQSIAATTSRQEVRAALGVPDATRVLVMAGFTRPWHGADRAVRMLAELTDAPYELWLIGADAESERSLSAEAQRAGVTARVRLFPPLRQPQTADLVAAADLGIGPLALDRKWMQEAQPIKVRFYLSLNVPVLLNYRDLGLPDRLPFVLECLVTDPRILAASVRQFFETPRAFGRSIAAYARENLDWTSVAREEYDFMTQVVGGAGAHQSHHV